jgi:hypothetical protein
LRHLSKLEPEPKAEPQQQIENKREKPQQQAEPAQVKPEQQPHENSDSKQQNKKDNVADAYDYFLNNL